MNVFRTSRLLAFFFLSDLVKNTETESVFFKLFVKYLCNILKPFVAADFLSGIKMSQIQYPVINEMQVYEEGIEKCIYRSVAC